MMRKIAFIGVVVILLTALGCSKDQDGNMTPEIYEYVVMPGKRIVEITDTLPNGYISTYYTVVPGNNLVFKALYEAAQYDNILDDEHTEILWFEIDSGLTDFFFEDEEIAATKAYFVMYGAWVPNTPFTFETGYLSGGKISGEYWQVMAELETEANNSQKIEIKLNNLFRIEQ